ncbi:MAG: amino acid ABC transporter substrate-binding protein [Chitinophagaceae bacterium]|nr:amino acid ABC transporter substrate-binding protein [Chitinophagaceae bacterium]
MISAVNRPPQLSGNSRKNNHYHELINMTKYIILFLAFLSAGKASMAQPDQEPRFKIAIFAPLYLDSAFNEDVKYRYPGNTFPKFINPGLEFYEGAQLALDSLKKEYQPLDVFIFDTRSATETIAEQLSSPGMEDVSLIIAHGNATETKLLAEAGLSKHIPVINANLPNDGGISGNPFFVMLNPTLRTQCEGIYRYLQKYYALSPIVVFRKKGSLEDRIKNYFDDFSRATMSVALKIKYVELTDSFNVNHLKPYLDTITSTLCVAGSLDENFGKRLVQQLAALKKKNYNSSVVGMPTWDGINFNKPEFKGIDIIYSTPFYNPKTDKVSLGITNYFNKKMFARPSDMVFRGYEVTFRFARLLRQYQADIASNLANKNVKLFTDFDIQPVLNKQSMTLDYFENKKLYFLKWQDGMLKGIY